MEVPDSHDVEHAWEFRKIEHTFTFALLCFIFFPTICNLWLDEWMIIIRNPLFWIIHAICALNDYSRLHSDTPRLVVSKNTYHQTRHLYLWTLILDTITTVLQAGTLYKRQNVDTIFQFVVLAMLMFASFWRFVVLHASTDAVEVGGSKRR